MHPVAAAHAPPTRWYDTHTLQRPARGDRQGDEGGEGNGEARLTDHVHDARPGGEGRRRQRCRGGSHQGRQGKADTDAGEDDAAERAGQVRLELHAERPPKAARGEEDKTEHYDRTWSQALD